jgi:hypothetical protein
MNEYTLEHCFKIYDEESGSYCEISPDPDGLGMIHILDKDSTGKIINELFLHKEELDPLIEALTFFKNETENPK